MLTHGLVKDEGVVLSSVQFCSSVIVKGLFTSDIVYADEELPKDFCLKVPQGKVFTDLYD